MSRIRVLIVDDSATMRGVIGACLSRDPQIAVAGEAADPIEARAAIKASTPPVDEPIASTEPLPRKSARASRRSSLAPLARSPCMRPRAPGRFSTIVGSPSALRLSAISLAT